MLRNSLNDMVTTEKDIWDNLISGSTDLLKLLNEFSEGSQNVCRYINVLFGLRCAKLDSECIKNEVSRIYESNFKGHKINVFLLQKRIKDYYGSIDSTIDYLDKLSTNLKDGNGLKIINYSRKDHIFEKKISKLRNEVLHEGMPILYFDRTDEIQGFGCQAHCSGNTIVSISIEVAFAGDKKFNNFDDKILEKKPLDVLVCNTYDGTVKIVQSVTSGLINTLDNRNSK